MERIFDLIGAAKQAVLFLAFDPGNNSILDAAGQALAKNPDLFVRGALTSSQRASNFSEALHQGGEADEADEGSNVHPGVAVVGELGGPKKKGAKAPKGAKPNNRTTAPIDYRAIPAGSINASDAFGAWEAELQKFGFAIIHNKIVVIDPFSANCVVVTGSHNLGFRASHNNDENLVIIRGHRGLAEAYACHVLDIYDHYAFRYWLKADPKIFSQPLEADDKWQERYIVGPDEKAPELRFWLAAASAGVAGSAPKPSGSPAATKPASAGGGATPAKTPPAAKPAAKKPAGKKPSAKKPSAKKRPGKKTKPAGKVKAAKKTKPAKRKPPKKRKTAAKPKKRR